MKKILQLTILLIFLGFNTVQAAEYYISTTGDDTHDGLTLANAWATFSYADTQLQPGDTLWIDDGTYDQKIITHSSGTEAGGYISYKAINNFQVILAPTVDTDQSTIQVFSCPGCGGGLDNPVQGYIKFEGVIVRSIGENSAIDLMSSDVATEAEMTHHIIVKNCGFYGSSQETNSVVMGLGNNLRDSLIEDVFSYGRSRKAGEAFGCLRVTIRRAVMRYDYWEGDDYKPNDPRTTFSGYNTQDSIFENMIVIDTAETPPGYSADRGGFAASGNETPATLSGSARNKYMGLIVLNNVGNGIEVNGGSGDPNEDLIFKDILLWRNLDDGGGINVQGNDDASDYSFLTLGESFIGFRLDPYPHAPITNEHISNIFSTGNTIYGYLYSDDQVSVVSNITGTNNAEESDIDPEYAPDISTRFLDPIMVSGHERGATIVNRYVDGVLTNTPLWPYPNEDIIKQHMCNPADLALVHRSDPSDPMFVGKPGWCETNKTLTEYIWEANGATCPSDICTYGTEIRADVDQSGTTDTTDAMLTLRNSLGLDMNSTNWQPSATTGDVDCNGLSNTTDAILILRYSLGLDMSSTNWCLD